MTEFVPIQVKKREEPTIVYILHGMASKKENLQSLAEALKERVEGVEIDSRSYDWRKPVLESGLELAKDIMLEKPMPKRVVLVGHSQGGLVCRVAAVALKGVRRRDMWAVRRQKAEPEDLVAAGDLAKAIETWWEDEDGGHNYRNPVEIAGVVLLATPNCGAFTYGQLSVLGRIALRGITKAADLWGVDDLADLTSDRLFRALQFFEVKEIPYLSVSGSAVSRYSSVNHDDLGQLPVVRRLGVHLERPNDLLVEDCSVDMEQAPLPSEVKGEYRHIRRYLNCTDVSHTNIHSNMEVHRILANQISYWLLRQEPSKKGKARRKVK